MPSVSRNGSARHIVSFTALSFVVYLAIGLPLAILPEYVHLRMGYSATLAGLVISIQYIATFLSRPWAGRISDHKGAKISVVWGMAACTLSGLLLLAAAALHRHPAWLSLACLIVSRLVLGVGESLGSTGATLWGIASAGTEHTARVIAWNGVSTYGALALGAPLGVVMKRIGASRRSLSSPCSSARPPSSLLPSSRRCRLCLASIFRFEMFSGGSRLTVWDSRSAA